MVYGAILTAWSAGGIAGPQLVAFLNDHYAAHLSTYAFLVNAGVLSIGLLLTLLLGEPLTRIVALREGTGELKPEATRSEARPNGILAKVTVP